MLQAAIDACAGKNAGDSCTVSFGSGNTGSPQGMQPPGSNGTMPAGPAGNGTAPSGMQQQPTGTCQTVNSTLSCTMQRPARG